MLCYVLEVREARATVRLRVCYEAFREDDGSTSEEWVDLNRVRPLPPTHSASFVSTLRKGAPLEINFEEGWWEVSFEATVGPKYVVGADRYKVQHTVLPAQLRPAWKWTEKSCTWAQPSR
jgi:hypothetical protein